MATRFFKLALTLSLVLVSAIQIAQADQNQVEYPTWFWHPPDKANYATGMIQPCLNNELSEEMAKNKAVVNILKQGLNRVESESDYYITPEGRFVDGQMPTFSFDSLGYDGISDDYMIMMKFYDEANFLMVVLVGPKADSGKFNNYYEYQEYGDWIHEIPEDGKNLFAVGTSPHYIYEKSCWETAATEALIELSRQAQIELDSEHIQESGSSYGGTFIKIDVTLVNWRVVARAYDPLYKIHYVLVKMPLNKN